MKLVLLSCIALALAACGDAPKPKPVPKAAEIPAAPKPEPAVLAPKADPDKELAGRVKRALEEAKVQAAGIDVTAKGGAVTLWGTAASVEEMRRAAQAAAKVDGVKSVDNRLQVIRGS